MITYKTTKGAAVTVTAQGTDGIRIVATAGGNTVIDAVLSALSIDNVTSIETGATRRCIKLGERFVEVPAGQEDAIRSLMASVVEARRQAESTAFFATAAGQAEIERRRNEREFDARHNEGGEGYNPYRRV